MKVIAPTSHYFVLQIHGPKSHLSYKFVSLGQQAYSPTMVFLLYSLKITSENFHSLRSEFLKRVNLE